MSDDLSRYRWHTGARLRRLAPEERPPPLFRDVGPDALALFLRGGMRRLAGPCTPLTYLRTWRWEEPYVDHARTGRLVVLAPRALGVWHSGVEHVYVARADRWPEAMIYVPGDEPRRALAERLGDARTVDEAREALGDRLFDERLRADLAQLEALCEARDVAERGLAPLRRALQAGEPDARARMRALGVDEADLCAAWHHLSADRRAHLARVTA